jgi:dTDP-glucose pyrophosphorylase
MKQPSLVIMAAGIGSRFGGLKQLAPVGRNGEPIIEFSLHDAIAAGFRKVIFVIKDETKNEFRRLIGDKFEKRISVKYACQRIDQLPYGYAVPKGRTRPWGTGHAVMAASGETDGPFAVINADDYYGKYAFTAMYNHLLTEQNGDRLHISMIGYRLENTVTEHGHVSRGICKTKNGYLESVLERLWIEKHEDIIEYTEDEGLTWVPIEKGSLVSMNFWGFPLNFQKELKRRFPTFLKDAFTKNPMKEEYLLPRIVNDLLAEGKASVKVLHTKDKWYGITYKEDIPKIAKAIRRMQELGLYP